MCIAMFAVVLYSKRKYQLPQKDNAFVQRGYTNWRDATIAFRNHEHSSSHIIAVETMITFFDYEKCEIFRTSRSCTIRGDGNESNSNFVQLLKLMERSKNG